jgi:FkbM family methyltransferase
MTTTTYDTKFGKVTLYKNDHVIAGSFSSGGYWDEQILAWIQPYIDPKKNILEIGGHCGTSSLVYSSYLEEPQKIHVYEPQRNMYNLLVKNVEDNHLQHKIVPYHLGVFCYSGQCTMNNDILDSGGGNALKRYGEESHLACNFGGLCLGKDGEQVDVTTIDEMSLENLGFIHCDAQGAESFIFSRAKETITKFRPVILYENKDIHGCYLHDKICREYPQYAAESEFDLKKYCMEELGYTQFFDAPCGSCDTLLVP